MSDGSALLHGVVGEWLPAVEPVVPVIEGVPADPVSGEPVGLALTPDPAPAELPLPLDVV